MDRHNMQEYATRHPLVGVVKGVEEAKKRVEGCDGVWKMNFEEREKREREGEEKES